MGGDAEISSIGMLAFGSLSGLLKVSNLLGQNGEATGKEGSSTLVVITAILAVCLLLVLVALFIAHKSVALDRLETTCDDSSFP